MFGSLQCTCSLVLDSKSLTWLETRCRVVTGPRLDRVGRCSQDPSYPRAPFSSRLYRIVPLAYWIPTAGTVIPPANTCENRRVQLLSYLPGSILTLSILTLLDANYYVLLHGKPYFVEPDQRRSSRSPTTRSNWTSFWAKCMQISRLFIIHLRTHF